MSYYGRQGYKSTNYYDLGTKDVDISLYFRSSLEGQAIVSSAYAMEHAAYQIWVLYKKFNIEKANGTEKTFVSDMSRKLSEEKIRKMIFLSKKFMKDFSDKCVFDVTGSFLKSFSDWIMKGKATFDDYCAAGFYSLPHLVGSDAAKEKEWTIRRNEASEFLKDMSYETQIDFLLKYANCGVTKEGINELFDVLIGIIGSSDKYTSLDIVSDVPMVMLTFLYYYEKENDIARADRIFDLAQISYKNKSLNFLKSVKPFMAKKKNAKTNPSKPVEDVLDTRSPFIMYWYADYYLRKFGKIPQFYTTELARQRFIEAYIDRSARGTVSDGLRAKFEKFFDETMLKGSTDKKCFMTYCYLVGYCKGIYLGGELVDYFSQNFDTFGELIREKSKEAGPAGLQGAYGTSYKDSRYSSYELIVDLAVEHGREKDRGYLFDFIIKYINYAMPSDKIIRILVDSFLVGANTPVPEIKDAPVKKTVAETTYGKSDFLKDADPIATDWTKNKLLRIVLE